MLRNSSKINSEFVEIQRNSDSYDDVLDQFEAVCRREYIKRHSRAKQGDAAWTLQADCWKLLHDLIAYFPSNSGFGIQPTALHQMRQRLSK